MAVTSAKKPVKLQRKTHPYDAAEHKADVVALLDKMRTSPLATHWAEVRPLLREVRAHLSVRIKRSDLTELLRQRIDDPPSFCGRLSPREAGALRTIIRHGEEVRVRFYRSDARSRMKVWIAGKGFEHGNVLSNAASMALRKRGILIRDSEGVSGGDSGLFRLAPRAAEAGMFWVQ